MSGAASTAGQTYSVPFQLDIPKAPPLGLPAEVAGTIADIYLYLNNLALALTVTAGVGPRDPSQWDILSGSPTTLLMNNMGRFYGKAGEALAYGDIVTIASVAGIPTFYKAVAALAGAVHPEQFNLSVGFCSTVLGIAAGDTGEIILGNSILPASAITPGVTYYLSTAIPGALSPARNATAANVFRQFMGVGLTTTAVLLRPGELIILPSV